LTSIFTIIVFPRQEVITHGIILSQLVRLLLRHVVYIICKYNTEFLEMRGISSRKRPNGRLLKSSALYLFQPNHSSNKDGFSNRIGEHKEIWERNIRRILGNA
jgi:hypothetical protein